VREAQRERERERGGSRGIDAGLEEIIRGGASAFVNASRGIGFSRMPVFAGCERPSNDPDVRDGEEAAIQQPPRIRGSRPPTRAPPMCCSLAYHMRDADGGARTRVEG